MPDSRIPIEVATAETARFVVANVPPAATLIEVGAGDGRLAAALQARGYDVTAVDTDPECVARASGRGVRAVTAEWPRFDGTAVDAIAFTRSLHHMHPLGAALDGARRMLRPGGILVLEEFAYEAAGAAALRWFRDIIAELAADSLLDLGDAGPQLLPRLMATEDPVGAWRDYHEAHGVHDGATLLRAVRESFHEARTTGAPYLYRVLIPRVPATARGGAAIGEILQREERALADGSFAPIGLRVVAVA
jgi:SAM-dependent methyltransferase